MSTREQCVGLNGEEFTKKWEALPPDLKIFMAGLSKDDFTKQTAHLNTFNVGDATLKKQTPQQRSPAKSFPLQSELSLSQSQASIQPLEARQDTPAIKPFKNNKQFVQHKE